MTLTEKALIARVRRQAARGRRIVTGIGDDTAVLRIPSGHEALVTTDFSLEGVHFRRDGHSPESIGHRCLARGLSDIAAMGGEPLAVFLSLALPRDLPQSWVDRFTRGLLALAGKHKVSLAGGDTAESPRGAGILADIVVVGSAPKGAAILRSGARPGDGIYVSGELGGSAVAVQHMRSKRTATAAGYPRHFFPEPRLRIGRILREKKLASAMIDLSDGLSTDLGHICEESGVGAELIAQSIPLATVGQPRHAVDLELALHGGEDYELLFTTRKDVHIPQTIAGVRVTKIGQIGRGQGMKLKDEKGISRPLRPRGWQHFAQR